MKGKNGVKNKIELVSRTWEFYVGAFNPGDWYTRREVAETNGLPYTTVVYNLEQAVKAGALTKHKYLVNGQPTWVYGLPETMVRLAVSNG